MRRRLLLFLGFFLALTAKGQNPYDFTTVFNGTTLYFRITDAAKHYVEIVPKNMFYGNGNEHLTTFPARVTNTVTNTEYEVKSIGANAFLSNDADDFYIPEGVETINSGFLFATIKRLHLPTTLRGSFGMGEFFGEKLIGMEHTQIEQLPDHAFGQDYALKQDWMFPETLRLIGEWALVYDNSTPDTEITFPASLTSISRNPWYYSTIDPKFFPKYKKATFNNPVPATVKAASYSGVVTGMTHLLGTGVDSVFVPVDATRAYETHADWSYYAGKYHERVKIGATGYTTYYLENENFVVPTGCTAYIITGFSPKIPSRPSGRAMLTSYAAGKILPRQTGFILRGTPNTTVTYQANVTGMEENVAGNLLVGTATEQEFSSAGDKYYVFANGDYGLGFYTQGTRGGASIKLKPHRAGLCLSVSSGAPAKGIIIDFDEAEPAVTVIDTPAADMPKKDIIYNLQGQRVARAEHGIYIINGKKVIK